MIAPHKNDNPMCPDCGSEYASKISGAMLPDDTYDDDASGIFECCHCRNEYQFLKISEAKEQTFAPTAPCPFCKSYKTKTIKSGPFRRYHICLNSKCLKPFRTLRPTTERSSKQN